MNPLIQVRKGIPLYLVVLTYLVLSLIAQAVNPPLDCGYPNQNTAERTSALQSLTSGVANMAVGFVALFSNTRGSNNTATGNGTAARNTIGDDNTANGFGSRA
jgi:hypothetical protein